HLTRAARTGENGMADIPVHWWIVVIAAFLRMVVGTVWYSPALFVKPWQRLTGVTPESMQRGLLKAIVVDLALSLLLSYALFRFVVYAHALTWWGGALVGLLAFLGFVLATHLPLWAYENRPLKLIALNMVPNLISMVLMGMLFGLWH
ncbi:MAG TPA: DUF1761 domain-containing protein, partial [Devosia sp.]|nr:DUF1761 domain-containing protein [Devosia sp.]